MSTTLTKSRFKLALECPRKLAYTTDKRYANAKSNDELLQALANGGHQVGALAKLMYPGGIEIVSDSIDDQISETEQLLQQEDVTLFEATFRHGNLVIRVDVLVKKGAVVDLVEVKAKGFNPTKDTFRGKRQPIATEWRPYLYDVAFQALVLERAHPEWTVNSYLMLLDTSSRASIDSLGSMFQIVRNGRRVNVTVRENFDFETLSTPLLRAHDVSEEVSILRANPVDTPAGTHVFEKLVDWLAEELEAGRKLPPFPGVQCKRCEFYCDPNEITDENRSGWAECIEGVFHRKAVLPRTDTVFGLYNHRNVVALLGPKTLFLTEIDEDALNVEDKPGEISTTKRHLLQIMEAKGDGNEVNLERETLDREFRKWKFPLHFIDFETSRPALPFHEGRRPNDLLLFQFSHHVLESDGRLRHASQCLMAEPGVAPSIAVVRALQVALAGNAGTVVHWWDHEKTVLKELKKQIADSGVAGRDELIEFIDTLIDDTSGRLADLGRLVSRTAFFEGTNGRSSIKKVLPAILAKSDFLKERYGKPVYGTNEIPSLNFPSGWVWLREENGQVCDPYKLLAPILLNDELMRAVDQGEDEFTGDDQFIANGGAAMIAYAELQNPDLDERERLQLVDQLKRYCELDTLAMVMVYEALNYWLD